MSDNEGYKIVSDNRQVRYLYEILETYEAGVDLYLPKPFELQELGAAIRNLLERSQMVQALYRLSYEEVRTPLQPSVVETKNTKLLLKLTQREQEVLELLTHGLSNADMGIQLHLSPRTVEKHVSSLLRKTESSNRAELVRFAMEHRLVE